MFINLKGEKEYDALDRSAKMVGLEHYLFTACEILSCPEKTELMIIINQLHNEIRNTEIRLDNVIGQSDLENWNDQRFNGLVFKIEKRKKENLDNISAFERFYKHDLEWWAGIKKENLYS